MLRSTCFSFLACLLMLAGANAQVAPDDSATTQVQVLSQGQMAKGDVDLLASHRAEVRQAAQFHGFDVAKGTWIETQVVCPDAPRHLIMHYLKLEQDGSVSLFTAVIPRGQAPVRIIPVLQHGAQTIRIFGSTPSQRDLINEVIATRLPSNVLETSANWTRLASCYAALGGAEPSSTSITTPEQTTPRLALGSDGKVRQMSFTVLGPDHYYQDWTVEFDRDRKVKSIGLTMRPYNSPLPLPSLKPLKQHPIPAPVDLPSKQVPLKPGV